MASPARWENNRKAPSTEPRTAGGTTSRMTAESGPLYHVYRKNVANRSGTNQRSSSTSSNAAHTGPPSTNPAPETTTRPPGQRPSSQSPTRPPNSPPSAPPASPQIPNSRPTRPTENPCTRSMKLGAHAISPFTANVTREPPTNIQIRVGVRSTVAAAWRKSSNAVAATTVASVVRRMAMGTNRITVHTTPTVTKPPNTAVSTPDGRRWNSAITPLTAAPASVRPASGSAGRTRLRTPLSYQRARVAQTDAGACRWGSRSREARSASTSPGAPIAMNAVRQP